MVDMNGLGIVLEEQTQEMDKESSHGYRDQATTPPQNSHMTSILSHEKSPEILLPPLPDENDLNESFTSQMSSPSKDQSHSHDNVSSYDGPDSYSGSNSLVDHSSNTLGKSTQDLQDSESYFFQNSNGSFSTYELDSPSINLDGSHIFPSISSASNSTSTSNTTTNTSPLKRLRSLKKTIRKLSLSKPDSSKFQGFSGSIQEGQLDNSQTPNLQSSGINSSLGPALGSSISNQTTSSLNSNERPQVLPIQSHFKTLSQDSNGSCNTIDSRLKGSTPTTPSNMSSPVITLSDSSLLTKEQLQKIEQNYFETFKMDASDKSTDLKGDDKGLSQSNLMNYYNHLINERNLINDSYNLTKARLVKSGWCSNDDLNNLNVQKNNQLNQLNGKINEINSRLQNTVTKLHD